MINDTVTVDLETTLDLIMERIGEMSYPEDAPLIRNESKNLLRRGWLPSEIVPYQRCCEHVDKDLAEDVALARMAVIEQRVLERLNRKGIHCPEDLALRHMAEIEQRVAARLNLKKDS